VIRYLRFEWFTYQQQSASTQALPDTDLAQLLYWGSGCPHPTLCWPSAVGFAGAVCGAFLSCVPSHGISVSLAEHKTGCLPPSLFGLATARIIKVMHAVMSTCKYGFDTPRVSSDCYTWHSGLVRQNLPTHMTRGCTRHQQSQMQPATTCDSTTVTTQPCAFISTQAEGALRGGQ
jgi:hypothetical protein